MKRKAILLTWIHLLLSVYLVVPKELMHALHNCHETQDMHDDFSRELISTIHNHCEIMQLDAPPVAMEVVNADIVCFNSDPVFFDADVQQVFTVVVPGFHERGPPVLS
jgi:hypothetical protein